MTTLSLVVATRGRPAPFAGLFASLEAQTFRDFEVIIVDQNADRVETHAADWSFPIIHLHTPTEKGLSRARNTGRPLASGSIVLFPDDDCWYPPHFLAHALAQMEALDVDVLTGRAADETGRDINGRYAQTITRINRTNVFTTGIEWVVFFKHTVIDAVGGYDQDIGVGAATPWQSCEGPDIILRALDKGFTCSFDPSVYGHHAELDIKDPSMLTKGKGYARGLGYVLRRHGYPKTTVAIWILRPIVRVAMSLARRDMVLVRYYRNVAIGRFEGWRMKVITPSASSPYVAVRSTTAKARS